MPEQINTTSISCILYAEYGGLAHVFKTKGFPSSSGSTRFGVTTSKCGPQKRGYAFSSKKVSTTSVQTENKWLHESAS